jgi:hypothetical protein
MQQMVETHHSTVSLLLAVVKGVSTGTIHLVETVVLVEAVLMVVLGQALLVKEALAVLQAVIFAVVVVRLLVALVLETEQMDSQA